MNAELKTPNTAPNVFIAYSAPVSSAESVTIESIGSVAPWARAGESKSGILRSNDNPELPRKVGASSLNNIGKRKAQAPTKSSKFA